MQDRMLKIGVGLALAAFLGAAYYAYQRSQNTPAAPPAAAQRSSGSEAVVAHPLPPPASARTTPLPPLAESDTAVRESLAELFGRDVAARAFVQENLVRRIVATVDNLPRGKVAVDMRPVVPTGGSFRVAGPENRVLLDPRNFERYAPAVAAMRALDARRLAATYTSLYPLFQQAYQDLGYPAGYFNDRLVAVIDHLLATPEVREPIALVQPRVFYEFADPALEARSAGQKLLIRMGPQNASVVKAKLRELRAEVTRLAPAR